MSVNSSEIGITHISKAHVADATNFDHCLLKLGSPHQLVIYNALQRWLGSEDLTCFPHEGGESIINYLMGRLWATHIINTFWVGPCTIGADHSCLYFELNSDVPTVSTTNALDYHTTIHFKQKLSNIYSLHVEVCFQSLDSSLSLETFTIQVIDMLHCIAINTFPYTRHY